MSNKKTDSILSNKLRRILAIAYITVLLGGSGLVILDSLVISRSYLSFSNETTSSSSSSSNKASVSTSTAYEDDYKKVTIKTYERNSTKIYVAFVTLKKNSSIKSALAGETYGKNVTDTT